MNDTLMQVIWAKIMFYVDLRLATYRQKFHSSMKKYIKVSDILLPCEKLKQLGWKISVNIDI